MVNCPTLSEELLASEMFGHAKGSFTGAVRDQAGRVEAAEGGTLFLDEVGEISPALQAKLLRFLQEKQFERIGENRTRQADVRVVAATNRDLEADVRGRPFSRGFALSPERGGSASCRRCASGRKTFCRWPGVFWRFSPAPSAGRCPNCRRRGRSLAGLSPGRATSANCATRWSGR